MASTLTLQQLKSFHTIDRILFSRLVINLQRDSAQSMQVVAFYIWLEQARVINIVVKVLELPDTLVNALADEAVTCLSFLERESGCPPPTSPGNVDIPLTHFLVGGDISLQFLHERRLSALAAITGTVNNVCIRTFDDIVRWALRNHGQPPMPPRGASSSDWGGNNEEGSGGTTMVIQGGAVVPGGEGSMRFGSRQLRPYFGHGVGIQPRLMPAHDPNYAEMHQFLTHIDPHNPKIEQRMPIVFTGVDPRCAEIQQRRLQFTSSSGSVEPKQQILQVLPNYELGYGGETQRQQEVFQNFPSEEEHCRCNEMQQQLSQLLLSDDPVDNKEDQQGTTVGEASENLNPGIELQDQESPVNEVPQEERTLFITFSRGYQLSKTEVIDYFTRNYGACIESLHMQEVPSCVQPLFARMVIRSASTVTQILNGSDKAKFAINGKHVWVRRYVTRRSTWPPPPPPPAAAYNFFSSPH